MKFSIPYTNHGLYPVQIEDIVLLLKYSIESVPGNIVNLSMDIDTGACNIILENFSEHKFLRSLVESSADYIIVATEFITNGTFNDFHSSSDYGPYEWWKVRYDCFIEAAKLARAVWCFSEEMVRDYKQVVGDKVFFFPMTYVPGLKQFSCRPSSGKDIDILFTGTITAYRRHILDLLSASGFGVIALPTSTPTYIRNDLCARTRVAVNIRQYSDWKYPSLMRYHYHIMNMVPLVGEKCEIASYLDNYVAIAEPCMILDKCREIIEGNGKSYLEQYQAFINDMPSERFIPDLLDRTMSQPAISKQLFNSVSKSIGWGEIARKIQENEEKAKFHYITEKFTLLEWTNISLRKFIRKILQIFHLKDVEHDNDRE